MKFADIFIAVLITCIILLIIFPLPSFFLDILLSLNISISLIILLTTLYTKEPLEFSIFPSLLLITTLFRLALNISSTRLILTNGDAGAVVATFGNFVIRGDVFVGFVIFLIIIVVQFIVITKGAERVSEVAARFTLDAMPGKQMAIDADLNSGLINEQQAKDRRIKIQRESDFYGAMDGASKFVKGDAIVGIIITIINIIGGIITGLMDGLDISGVMTKYTLLTVGDGLVSQLPALLISTATGIIVTRAASDSNLGSDLIRQMSGQPIALFVSGALLLFMGFIPGFPPVLFALGGLFLYFGYVIYGQQRRKPAEEPVSTVEQEAEEMRRPENVFNLLHIDPIELEFGYGIIPLADVNQGGDLLDRVIMIRRQIAMDLGIIVPIVRLRDNIQLNPSEYVIRIKGIEVSRGQVLADRFMIMNSGNAEGDIEGIDLIEPAFGLPAKWIEEVHRERAELLGYTVVDPPSVIATHLTEIIKKHAHELLSRQDVQNLLDHIREEQPSLVDEVVSKTMSLGEVQKVLANLVKEGVAIRDMTSILEALADYGGFTKDPDMLTEYVRQRLARSITNRFLPERRGKVITLDPELEQNLMESVQQGEHGSYLAMDPSKTQRIYSNLTRELDRLGSLGLQPIILTAPLVRLYFKKLTEQLLPDLIVLSYNELDSAVEIQSIGVVRG